MSTRQWAFREQVLDLAASQAGAIARRQLIALGLSESGVGSRVRAGTLFRVYEGAYSIARDIDRDTVWSAGVLAAGDGCVLSHMSAARLWGFGTHSGPTEVTRLTSGSRNLTSATKRRAPVCETASLEGHARIPILRIHHSRKLHESEVMQLHGIPVTSVARTFVDISASVGEGQLKKMLHEAQREGLLEYDWIRAAMDRARGKKGVRRLRRVINDWDPQTARTRNEFEKGMFDSFPKWAVPTPLVNCIVAGYEVDFFWPRFGLILEADGAQDHATPLGTERDKERDSHFQIRGFMVLRITRTMFKREQARSMRKVKDHLELCQRQGRRAEEGWEYASIGNR